MSRLYLDTEFNGFGGQLISMGMVSPDGNSWYGVMKLPDHIDPWVQEHVIPHLGVESWQPLTDASFRASLHQFLVKFKNPEIICDWHADAMFFCACLAGEDYASSLDYAFRLTVLKTPPGQPVSLIPHHALMDAQALMSWNEAREAA